MNWYAVCERPRASAVSYEGVPLLSPQGEVGVHSRPLDAGEWLRHEARREMPSLRAVSLTTRRAVMTVSAMVRASV